MANDEPDKGKQADGQGGQGQGSQGDQSAGTAGGGKSDDVAKGDGKKEVSYESHLELLKEKKAMQKKLADFEAKAKAESDAKLAADGKIKELLDLEKKARESALGRLKMAELKMAAFKAGMLDMEYLKILADEVEFDSDGIPQNAESFFNSLKEKKPYLFAQEKGAAGHANHGGVTWKPGATFTEKSIAEMNPEEFMKNFPEIQKQMAEGKIK